MAAPRASGADQPAGVSEPGDADCGGASDAPARRGLRLRLGVNIGPNKETPPERVADDIAAAAELLGPMADFIVINVSSPNTPGCANGRLRTICER